MQPKTRQQCVQVYVASLEYLIALKKNRYDHKSEELKRKRNGLNTTMPLTAVPSSIAKILQNPYVRSKRQPGSINRHPRNSSMIKVLVYTRKRKETKKFMWNPPNAGVPLFLPRIVVNRSRFFFGPLNYSSATACLPNGVSFCTGRRLCCHSVH